MTDIYEKVAQQSRQESGVQRLFSAVILASLDDAIVDERKIGTGVDSLRRWFRSRDGHQVLLCAGIEPTERALAGMIEFVQAGHPTSKALTRASKVNKLN